MNICIFFHVLHTGIAPQRGNPRISGQFIVRVSVMLRMPRRHTQVKELLEAGAWVPGPGGW